MVLAHETSLLSPHFHGGIYHGTQLGSVDQIASDRVGTPHSVESPRHCQTCRRVAIRDEDVGWLPVERRWS